ncbi:hypothetical protein L3Q82_006496 [Scortum barcoo]|uniref:Uncharacterized protein n=1 Tax=Scortum barcoo TaxID=214431 RepID=A0ACB8X091_9TELE|nr:hypothetical protein L3Q82_006496 [Scortum barcoo]
MDILPYQNEKLVTRSKLDEAAVRMLNEKTIRVEVDSIQRYATPLLSSKKSVLGHLRGTEKCLAKDPVRAESYIREIKKLLDAGYVSKLTPAEVQVSSNCHPQWQRSHCVQLFIVFTHQGASLNEHLLPGPTLGSTLLVVLHCFSREYPIAVSSDIKGMFHQVRLLPKNKPFLQFLWRDMDRSTLPDVYEWQVLPFGTMCSPCCTTYALQRHVLDYSQPGEDTRHSGESCFYVDNLLQSFTSESEAKASCQQAYSSSSCQAGSKLRQWATNAPEIISHMPPELRSESSEIWLDGSMDGAEPLEQTLGLLWHCMSDTIMY